MGRMKTHAGCPWTQLSMVTLIVPLSRRTSTTMAEIPETLVLSRRSGLDIFALVHVYIVDPRRVPLVVTTF